MGSFCNERDQNRFDESAVDHPLLDDPNLCLALYDQAISKLTARGLAELFPSGVDKQVDFIHLPPSRRQGLHTAVLANKLLTRQERESVTDYVAELAAAVMSTSIAWQQHDARVMNAVDELLVPRLSPRNVVDLKHAARRAAELAERVTVSSKAGVQWRTRDDGAVAPIDEGDTSESDIDVDVPATIRQLISNALRQHRAIQWSGLGAAILVSPIPGPLASPHAPPVGCLWLQRDDGRAFDVYDLALVRNICLRLTILQSTANAEEISHLITELSHDPNSQMHRAASSKVDPPGEDDDLSVDLNEALRSIRPILEPIAASTNSHSVSVRLALADSESSADHGLSLYRVGAFPRERMVDSPRRQEQREHGGLNWRTMASGKLSYAADASKEKDYHQSREGTASELSVPIRADGELIGTLNLESTIPSNYEAFLPQIEAVAAAIGRRIADERERDSQPLFERAAEVLDYGHGYAEKLLSLRGRVKAFPLPHADLTAINNSIEDLLEIITTGIKADSDSGNVIYEPRTVARAVSDALQDEKVLGLHLPDPVNVDELQVELTAQVARSIDLATRNVFSNIKRHSGKPDKSAGIERRPAEVVYGACSWDGARCATVAFFNTSPDPILPGLASRVYRVPLVHRDGLRLGAYLAAMRMRQIGGSISFAVGKKYYVRTVMVIPLTSKNIAKRD
jgi:transcriptional regulator with GAF, ATPase, and Fis domain